MNPVTFLNQEVIHENISEPPKQWMISVPQHLVKVAQSFNCLTTLDVHVVAYSTYLANQDYLMSDNDRYELSYLMAWVYATYPTEITKRFEEYITSPRMELGTCEAKPRLMYDGKPMTSQQLMFEDEDEYEDDDEFEERVGHSYAFSIAAEKTHKAENPDAAMVAAYLRKGPDASLRSFMRRSFVAEEFTESAQSISIALYARSQNMSLMCLPDESMNSRLRKYEPFFLTVCQNMNDGKAKEMIGEESYDTAVEMVERSVEKEPDDAPVNKSNVLEKTSVSLVRLNTYAHVLDKLDIKWVIHTIKAMSQHSDLTERLPPDKDFPSMIDQPKQLVIIEDIGDTRAYILLETRFMIRVWENFKNSLMNEDMLRTASMTALNPYRYRYKASKDDNNG